MECPQCGTELHPDQKVCIKCGKRTVAGGGFDYGTKEAWRPSRNMIYAAGGVVALIILVAVLLGMRTTPPEVVAQEWFDAMAQRKIRTAQEYVTPAFEEDLSKRMMDLRALADEYYDDISERESPTYTAGGPVMQGPKNATVTITLKDASGYTTTVDVQLVKIGRQWKVNNALG